MITSMMGRMADAEKLSIPQLQMAIKNGTIPAYVGVPMLQDKVKQIQQAQQAQPAPAQPPIAQQVMEEASGIDRVPSNLPAQTMHDGGIVAFADGGEAEDFNQEDYEDQLDEAEYSQAIEDRLNAAEQGGGSKPFVAKPIDVNRTPSVEGGIKAPAGDFYKNMYSTLKAKAEEMGFKNPEAIARVGAAQSALETGYGKALAGGNNYFGIKGSGGNKQSTKEYSPERGYYTSNESFRTYNNMGDSAADYLRLMQNPRYAKVAAAETPEEAIAYQGKSGYATTPSYASALRSIHQANMADGGIARLNKGGVPRFNGQTGSVPNYDPMGNYIGDIENDHNVPSYSSDPYQLNLENGTGAPIQNIPGLTTPAGAATGVFRPQRGGKPSIVAPEQIDWIPKQDISGLGFTPNAPSSQGVTSLPNSLNYEYGTGSAPSSTAVNTPSASPMYEPREEPILPTTTNAETPAGTSQASGVERLIPEKPKSDYDIFREDMLAQRAELKKQKEEDKYMALISAGLGMMSGTSPNALANIGQGAQAGIGYAAQANKQRAAENAALNKSLMTGQRYKNMDEMARAALADRTAGRADLIAEKASDRDIRERALNERTETEIDKSISLREKELESKALAQLKLDPMGGLTGDQTQKYNDLVAALKAEDIKKGPLKGFYERKQRYQKQLWDIDYPMPDYGTSSSTSVPSGVTVRKVK